MRRLNNFFTLLMCVFSIAACGQQPETSDADKSYNELVAELQNSSPAYTNAAYTPINDNSPLFTADDITTESFEYYSELDALQRCGVCIASVSTDIMPTEERGSIGSIKPSGWQSVKYDIVDGKYLYNRCHLIGYQLTGENANESNLITGTRYLNMDGMLPFENMVADYIKETNNHVMYRATPIFSGDNLVAGGVLLEGYSVEDNGEGISFCVYCHNVQPGIVIDYSDGTSKVAEENLSKKETTQTGNSEEKGSNEENKEKTDENPQAVPIVTENEQGSDGNTDTKYILNTNTKKIHLPSCSSVEDIKEGNKEETSLSKEALLLQGYTPCGRCKP